MPSSAAPDPAAGRPDGSPTWRRSGACDATDPAALPALLAAYRARSGAGFPDPAENPVVAVRPAVVLGIIERKPEFTTMAIRWVFRPANPGGEIADA